MNLFRRLTADMPGELLAAQVATTSRAAETAATQTPAPAADQQNVLDILGFLAEHPGVPNHDTPGFPEFHVLINPTATE